MEENTKTTMQTEMPETPVNKPEDSKKESTPYRSYATKEEWQNEIDGIIGGRLKDYRSMKEKMEQYEPVLHTLMQDLEADSVETLPARAKEKILDNRIQDIDLSEVQKELPNADLSGIREDKYFRMAIRAGMTPKEACDLALHSRELCSSAPAAEPRIQESALAADKGVFVKLTPSKMTFRELDEISARVARGETVSL